jgi:zinc transport system permease protein
MSFINTLINYPFMQYALLAGILAAVACGISGTYVVTKKISLLAGGISHTVLGGVGFVLYLNKVHGTNIPPIYGAMAVALLSAIIIGLVDLYSEYDSDTIIAVMWSLGMALGVIFISMTPGYSTDLMSYLFGNILMVTKQDIYILTIINIIVIFTGIIFYNKFSAICFDEDFARVKGINVGFYYILLLCITALTIVALIQVVGLILVIALLTMPAAIAKQYARSIKQMILIAIILGVFFTTSGLVVSYEPDLPSGAVIIVITTTFFVLSMLHKKYQKHLRPHR